jgi:hypothetical protein
VILESIIFGNELETERNKENQISRPNLTILQSMVDAQSEPKTLKIDTNKGGGEKRKLFIRKKNKQFKVTKLEPSEIEKSVNPVTNSTEDSETLRTDVTQETGHNESV